MPLVFGEVLYDAFPDRRVLGGAPFNVAWNLAALGIRPWLVSRVGCDADGDAVLEAMRTWGMQTGGVGRDARRPTGEVRVILSGGEPTYELLEGVAYDAIAAPQEALLEAAQPRVFYHGTLALRETASLSCCMALRRRLGVPVFLDVNLRAPWWREALLLEVVQGVRWLKCNEEEFTILSRLLGVCGQVGPQGLRALLEACGAGAVVVTRGARGVCALERSGAFVEREAVPVACLRDTVGAGDGFAAMFLACALRGVPLAGALERALSFAAAVCALDGATTRERTFYQPFLP